jgi:hypothetical protein
MSQAGFEYQAASGYWWDPKSCYFYDTKTQLYYHHSTNAWYQYNADTGQYTAVGAEQQQQQQQHQGQVQQGAGSTVQGPQQQQQQQLPQQKQASAAQKRRKAVIGGAAQYNPEGLLAAAALAEVRSRLIKLACYWASCAAPATAVGYHWCTWRPHRTSLYALVGWWHCWYDVWSVLVAAGSNTCCRPYDGLSWINLPACVWVFLQERAAEERRTAAAKAARERQQQQQQQGGKGAAKAANKLMQGKPGLGMLPGTGDIPAPALPPPTAAVVSQGNLQGVVYRSKWSQQRAQQAGQ